MTSPSPAIEQFNQHRGPLTSIAYRMLGSTVDVDDAIQETWLRAARAHSSDVVNVGSWLTTITARVRLNMLRARHTRREDPFDEIVDSPIHSNESTGPEVEATLADSVSLALLVVLETLDPAERLAFVLHDLFAVPFNEIAGIVERSPAAARQLASRARRRVQAQPPLQPTGVNVEHRRVVDAFFDAARSGNLDALLTVLDPDLVLHADGGTNRPESTVTVSGARNVATRAMHFAQLNATLRPVLINGSNPGVLAAISETRISLMSFSIHEGRIIRIDALVDPTRLASLTIHPRKAAQ
jgi:RNA polymerase sigma factor (sigma-70 family)